MRFKRFLGIVCAGCMALSVMPFANAVDIHNAELDGLVDNCPEFTVDGTTNLVEQGQLPDGSHYWVLDLNQEQMSAVSTYVNGGIETCADMPDNPDATYSWVGNVYVPKADGTGRNGAAVGPSFTAYPDKYVAFGVEGSLPSNMPTINVAFYYSNGENSGWKANLSDSQVIVFELRHPNQEGTIRVSTNDDKGNNADFWFITDSECPTNDFLRPV